MPGALSLQKRLLRLAEARASPARGARRRVAGADRLTGGGSDIGAASNAVLAVNAPITNGAASNLDIYNGGSGTVIFNGANTYTGITSIQSGYLVASSLNRVVGGTASSSLGAPNSAANGTIQLGNGTTAAGLIYAGSGETTDRVINLGGTGGSPVIEQAGTGVLTFSNDLTSSVAGAKTLVLQGSSTGSGVIAGAIVNTSSGAVGLTKAGTNTWTLQGSNQYTGTTTVSGGTLELDFANSALAANIVSASSPLAVSGGRLSVVGKATGATSQTFLSTAVNAGGSTISATQNGTSDVLVDLKAITRATGGTVSFVQPAGTLSATHGIVTSTAVNASGILGGYATVGNDWAAKDAANHVIAYTGYTDTVPTTGGSGTTNYRSATGVIALGGNTAMNSLRITDDGAGQALALSTSTLTIGATGGGLMYTGGTSNAYTISGTTGSLTAGANDLILHTAGADSNLTISALVSGTGGLTKSGEGTLLLTNTANSFSGNVSVNGGVLAINAPAVNGASADAPVLGTSRRQISLTNGGAFRLVANGTNNSYNPLGNTKFFVIGSGGGVFDLPTGTSLILDDGSGNTGAGADGAQLQGTGRLTKTGGGNLQLGYSGQTAVGFSAFTGDIVVQAGVLQAGQNNSLGSGALGTTTVMSGATLEFISGSSTNIERITVNGTGTTGAGAILNNTNAVVATLNGSVTLGSNSTIGGTSTGGIIINGLVSGAATLTKNGAGLLALTNENTYSGGTVVNGGTLRIRNNASLGDADGDLSFTGASTLQLQLPTTLAATRNVVLGAATTIDTGLTPGGGSSTIAGVISGGGSLLKISTGQTLVANPLILSGANTFTGAVTVNSGALVITNSSALGQGPKTVSVVATSNPGGFPSLQLDGSGGDISLPANLSLTTSYDALNGGVPIPGGGAIVNLAGNNTIAGNVTMVTGGGGTALVSNGGTLTMSGTLAPGAGVTARALNLRGSANGVITGSVNQLSGGTNAVSLSKDAGAGTWTLAGTNNYTGPTTVTAGTLLVDGSITGSASTVSDTGTLGGNGTTGAVTVNTGGTISPGSSIGTLNTGALALNADSTFALEINSSTLGSDRAAVTGNLSLAGTGAVTLSIADLGTSTLSGSEVFTFITYSGTRSGGLFSVGGTVITDYDEAGAFNTFNVGANQFAIDYDRGGNSVALIAVPEPTSGTLLLGCLGLAFGGKRFRRRSVEA